jgi:hypothetical protein
MGKGVLAKYAVGSVKALKTQRYLWIYINNPPSMYLSAISFGGRRLSLPICTLFPKGSNFDM